MVGSTTLHHHSVTTGLTFFIERQRAPSPTEALLPYAHQLVTRESTVNPSIEKVPLLGPMYAFRLNNSPNGPISRFLTLLFAHFLAHYHLKISSLRMHHYKSPLSINSPMAESSSMKTGQSVVWRVFGDFTFRKRVSTWVVRPRNSCGNKTSVETRGPNRPVVKV